MHLHDTLYTCKIPFLFKNLTGNIRHFNFLNMIYANTEINIVIEYKQKLKKQ